MNNLKRSDQKRGEIAFCEELDFRDLSGTKREEGADPYNSLIWISWESQRRTTELSRALGIRLFRFSHSGSTLTRYLTLTRWTWALLRRERPRVLIVQNPSLILTAVVAIMKTFFRFQLVVDRHTNFMINRPRSLQIRLLLLISDFSLRKSDLTIVTNQPLANLVEKKRSSSFVLPDKIPTPPTVSPTDLGSGRHICFICTYAFDEPYNEVIGLAPLLPPDVTIHITGRKKNGIFSPESEKILKTLNNIILTDYLSEEDYWGLLNGSDVVMDLTTLDHCLVCGAYEGLSLCKPLILSDKQVNQDLFGDSPVLVEPNTKDICSGITTILNELADRQIATASLKQAFVTKWDSDFKKLQTILLGEIQKR